MGKLFSSTVKEIMMPITEALKTVPKKAHSSGCQAPSESRTQDIHL